MPPKSVEAKARATAYQRRWRHENREHHICKMADHVNIQLVIQQDSWDCGVACLAMLLGKSYADVRQHVRWKHYQKEGLSMWQMRRLAKALGDPLEQHKEGDFSEMVGIVGLQRPTDADKPKGKWDGHYVVVAKGCFINPADGLIWTDIAAFLKERRWQPHGVLCRAGAHVKRDA